MARNMDIAARQVLDGVIDVFGAGWDQVSAFYRQRAVLIAKQAGLLAASRATGSLRDDDEGFAYEVGMLKAQVESVAVVLANLAVITVEKAVNALMGAIWKAMRGFLDARGLGDLIPADPPIM